MKRQRQTPDVVPPVPGIAIVPAVLSVKAAATYCACSVSFLNQLRAADTQRRARGESMKGPEWVRGAAGIRYSPRALDLWLAATSEPCGVMQSRRPPPRKNQESVEPVAQT